MTVAKKNKPPAQTQRAIKRPVRSVSKRQAVRKSSSRSPRGSRKTTHISVPGVRSIRMADFDDLRREVMQRYGAMRQHYDAASTSRLREDWSTAFDIPYADIAPDLANLIARSRREVSNNGIAQGIVKTIVANVIGTGLWPKPMVKDEKGELIPEINKILEDGWERFVDQFDVTGHNDLYGCQALSLETEIVSGTVLFNKVAAPKGSYLGISYQMIEPDRLDTNKDLQRVTKDNNDPQKQILHGIGLDEYYRALWYYLKGREKPISAANMFHHYLRKRPEQLIGVPWLHASLPDLWDYRQAKEDNSIKSRIIADIALWMHADDDWLKKNKKSDDAYVWEPASVLRSKTKPEVIQADDKMGEQLKTMMRISSTDACAGVGVSYMSVSRDMDGVNFAASRTNSTEDRRGYKAAQASEIRCWQRVYNTYTLQMVLEDRVRQLPLKKYLSDPFRFTRCHWQADGWDWVDPQNDAKASETMMGSGLTNLRSEMGKRGYDWREHLDQRAVEIQYAQKIAKQLNVSLDVILGLSKSANVNNSEGNKDAKTE